MDERFSRIDCLIGKEARAALTLSHVAVFGIGGVGGYCAEALARAGVGHITLVDNDIVAVSNLNRQITALTSTIGQKKVDVMQRRINDINPDIVVETKEIFFLPENADEFDFTGIDYIADAVDTVTAKIALVTKGESLGIPVISAMGTGNKLDPTAFRVADIYATKKCPLARVMRKELKSRGIAGLKVVYSEEDPLTPDTNETKGRSPAPGSMPFVPGAAGLIMAGEIVKSLII